MSDLERMTNSVRRVEKVSIAFGIAVIVVIAIVGCGALHALISLF